MSKNNANAPLYAAAIGIGAFFLLGMGRPPKRAASEKMEPGGFVPKRARPGGFTVQRLPPKPKPKKRPAPVPVRPKPKPLTKKEAKRAARLKKKAARNSPAAKAARLKKTGMALDFLTNIANTAASTAASFKK